MDGNFGTQKRQRDYIEKSTNVKKSTNYSEPIDMVNDSLTTVFRKIMPPILTEQWILNNDGRSKRKVRDIVDWSSADTQCINVIGDSDKSKNCWLCGGLFRSNPNSREEFPFKADHPLALRCEHVLPIAQAIFFLDIYKHKDKDAYTPQVFEKLKLEYGWAHNVCNGLKSDAVFMKQINGQNLYEVDEDRIDLYLDKLANKFIAVLIKRININPERFQEELKIFRNIGENIANGNARESIISKMTAVVDYINNRIRKDGWGLFILSNSAGLINPSNFNDGFRQLINRQIVEVPNQGARRRIKRKRRYTKKNRK